MAKGYGEAMALIEAGKQIALTTIRAELAAEKRKPERTEKKEKPPSFDQLWMEEKKRRDAFDAWMKDVKKIFAEEKKEHKHWWNDVDKVALLLLAIVPLNWAIMYLFFR